MAIISLASTSKFSALNTSEVLRPIILWIFPNLSEQQVATIHFATRKVAHFSEYAVLGILAARAFTSSNQDWLRRHWFLISLLLVVAYALLDEFHQSFVPDRSASIIDSVIDTAGGLTALLLIQHRFRTLNRPAIT